MTRYAFWICALAIGAMAVASLWALDVVPADARIAVHFGLDGEPDGFAAPGFAFSVLPLAAAAALALFVLIPRYAAIPAVSQPSYAVFAIAVILVLATAHALIIAKALSLEVSVMRWIAGALGVMFIVTGNTASRIRPNAVFGVRLPWTLGDPRVWARTHRLYGWLSVLLGIALVGLALSGAPDRVVGSSMLAGIVMMLLSVVIHSWWNARDEPGALS